MSNFKFKILKFNSMKSPIIIWDLHTANPKLALFLDSNRTLKARQRGKLPYRNFVISDQT